MNDTIPDWAGKRACELLNAEPTVSDWLWPRDCKLSPVKAIAKLVMQHEQPPVDPDEEALERVFRAAEILPEHIPYCTFKRAVSQYKQEKAK